MALRIKSRWHVSERNASSEKGLEAHAEALAFIAWRLALERAVNLHGEDYVYRSDGQRIAVVCEFLAYEVAVIDRLLFTELGDADRDVFMNVLGRRIADHVEDNARDLFGPRDYRGGFMDTLNERLSDYAQLGFGAGGPGYSFIRYLAMKVAGILGDHRLNKWSIDQVMEIDAQHVYRHIDRAARDLLAG